MRRIDLALLLAFFVIAGCSAVVQSSTAQALASSGFATRQVVWLGVGAAILLLFAFADYRVLARFSPLFWTTAVVVLVVLLATAPLRAGTRAWLVLGPYTVQPSEFARVVAILAVAALAGEHGKETLSGGVMVKLAMAVLLPAALVALQPDLGVALTYVPVLLAALYLGGLRWRAWVALGLAAIAITGAAWLWYLKPYQRERVLTFMDSSRATATAGYQQRQSRIAVGSGGMTGKGLRSGTQSQLRFLPAQHTDFIFAVWAEETGLVGSALLLAAYALLVIRVFLVTIAARDRVGVFLAGCIGFTLATQILVNVGMVVGLAPTTGVTLPLMSYGGSSVISTCVTLGLVQSVWRLRFANV